MQPMTKYKALVLGFSLFSIVGVTYQNCARATFNQSSTLDTRVGGLSDNEGGSNNDLNTVSGSIKINNGSEFVNTKSVTLNLSALNADEMYVTNDSQCQSGGNWEKYSENKLWQLNKENSDVHVYVSYKNSNKKLISPCYSASIVHDNIAPIVSSLKNILYSNDSHFKADYKAEDNLSGIDKISCSDLTGWKSGCIDSGAQEVTADGVHKIEVVATDKAGNRSLPFPISVVIDTTRPKIVISKSPPAITAVAKQQVVFSVSDNGSGISSSECRFANGAWTSCVNTLDVNSANGLNSVEIRATDKAGNISDISQIKWTLDTSVPTVQWVKTPEAITQSLNAVFEFTGKSNAEIITSFKCSLNSGPAVDCQSPFSTTFTASGKNNLSVIGYNKAGTASSPIVYSWIIDIDKPVVKITAAPAVISTTAKSSFSFNVSPVLSGIKQLDCKIDLGPFAKCDLNAVFENLVDGPHTISVQATSNSGVVGDATSYTWSIDTKIPTVKITQTPPAITNSTTASFAFTATDGIGQVDHTECQIDGAGFKTCQSPLNLQDIKRGVHVFQVKAIDKAGLVSEVASYSWTSENVGPQITLSLVTPSPYYSPANVEIKYSVLKSQFADISSVSCGLSTAIQTGCVNEAQISLSNLKTGSYTYKVSAKDSAGNSSEQTINFTVLDQPCELSAQTVPVKVIFIVDTSNSNVAYYETQAPTDPTKSFRTAEIKTMYDSYKNKSNFSWGFITFKGGLAYNLIGSDTSTPIFGNSAAMATAMTTFSKFSDGGRTPYAAALSMASSLIAGDKNKTADTKYIAVFLSDGEPSDGSTADSLKIGVQNLIDQAKGQVTMSTVFYGYSNKTASDRMTEMALNGGGQFVDMTLLPTGTVIDIKDIINLPGPGCK